MLDRSELRRADFQRMGTNGVLVSLVSLFLIFGQPTLLQAQERGPADLIGSANAALERGEYHAAEVAVSAVLILHDGAASKTERAEAFRILGLIKFYEGKNKRSRDAFLQYLFLDPDAHLDPALVPPEAISLLEDVRARNLAEIDSHRDTSKKRYVLLNLVPGAGQFQNGHRTKGILLSSGIGLLLATNLSTYFLLRNYCDRETRTCQNNGESIGSTAGNLKSANFISGIAAISLYIYSVVDGYQGYRRAERKESSMSFSVIPSDTGSTLGVSLSF